MVRGELVLPIAGGAEVSVPCLDGAARADVASAHPGVAHAATCGFMLMAAVRDRIDPARGARFVAEMANGERHEIALATLPLAPAPAVPGLLERLRGWRRHGLLGMPRAAGSALVARWHALVAERRLALHQRSPIPTSLVLDHDMGGGANAYRERLVDGLVAAGRRVAVVTPLLSALEYEIRVIEDGREVARWREPDEDALLRALDRMRIATVDLNDLVGFADPLRLVGWCVARRAKGATLTFHLHDFHAVCPAFTLIDAHGGFCGVPSLEVCRGCLPRNAANSLGLGQGVDPEAWRDAWAQLLAASDRVVVFSHASARILERAYPAMADAAHVEVRPHAIESGHLRAVRRGGGPVLKVGVVGNISRPKGADIVAGLVARAQAESLPVQVVVIGTLQASTPVGPHLVVHGAFDAQELPDLMERYGIDVCLMPSVCPETYSYVTDEIMAMGLPIAVFDIGAPAERVARYPLGEVIAGITADDALAAIIRLARRTVGPEAEGKEIHQWARP